MVMVMLLMMVMVMVMVMVTRYIAPSLPHPDCCPTSNETNEMQDGLCQCYPLLPMATLHHCGKRGNVY